MMDNKFKERKKELLSQLMLNDLEVLQSRNHWEVILCEDKQGRSVILKLLKQEQMKSRLQKEAEILKQVKSEAELRFPKLIAFGDDFTLTECESARHINFCDIHEAQVNLIVKILLKLHRFAIRENASGAKWNPGLKKLYHQRMLYWLCFLTPEYLTISDAIKCMGIVSRGYKKLDSLTTLSHRAFGMENLLFDAQERYIMLLDFEDFVVKDNFLYDALYLSAHPHERIGEWSWQKRLIRAYIIQMKNSQQCRVDKKTMADNARVILILVTLHHMGMRRIIDERHRKFQRMSFMYVFSRFLLRAARLIKLCKPLEISEPMKIRRENLRDLLHEDTFKKLINELLRDI